MKASSHAGMNTQLIAAVYGGGHIDYTIPFVTPLPPLKYL